MKKKFFPSTLFFDAFSKFSLENNFVLIPVIAVMIIIISPSSVFAVEFVLPPQAAPEDFPGKVPPDRGPPDRTITEVHGDLTVIMRLLYTTKDDPANHVVTAGATSDGIGDVLITVPSVGTFRCTGSLLLTGIHVLLAAHCITDIMGMFTPGTTATVRFEKSMAAGGDEIIAVTGDANFHVHPDWDGNIRLGNDIAILKLVSEASASVDRLDIDRDPSDDLDGSKVTKTGYGRSGVGETGDTLVSGTKRTGFNMYDQTHDNMRNFFGDDELAGFVPGAVLQYDFDNGLVANDAFGWDFGINDPDGAGPLLPRAWIQNPDLGVAPIEDEVLSAPGDSGGPTTSNPIITGVTSYGTTIFSMTGNQADRSPDFDGDAGGSCCTVNSSFGEFGSDTRVSSYASWIDGIAPPPSIEPTFCGRPESDFNRIDGTAGNNIIGGTDGDDLIFGGDGDDHIQGLGGNDCIFGEDGNDVLSGGDGDDEIHGGLGVDNINGRDDNDTIFGDAGDDIIAGGNGDDTIQGGPGNDQIQGNDGIDNISGNGGNDLISGGLGADTINGNAGDDIIAGREGIDTIDGGPDTDLCQDEADSISNCEL